MLKNVKFFGLQKYEKETVQQSNKKKMESSIKLVLQLK